MILCLIIIVHATCQYGHLSYPDTCTPDCGESDHADGAGGSPVCACSGGQPIMLEFVVIGQLPTHGDVLHGKHAYAHLPCATCVVRHENGIGEVYDDRQTQMMPSRCWQTPSPEPSQQPEVSIFQHGPHCSAKKPGRVYGLKALPFPCPTLPAALVGTSGMVHAEQHEGPGKVYGLNIPVPPPPPPPPRSQEATSSAPHSTSNLVIETDPD